MGGAMRSIEGDRILLSATDLMRFMGCSHATALDLAYMRGKGPVPREESDDAALLQKQGDAHEGAHLAKLKASGVSVIEIDRTGLADNARETRAALAEGPQIVFQGGCLATIGAAGRIFSSASSTRRTSAPSAMK